MTYTRGTNIKNVAEALNDLYTKIPNIDNYDDKTYTQEGLAVYDNRVTITDGGYYTDSNGTTWVNITFKTNKELSGNTDWLMIYNLPTINNNFVITDTEKQHAFYIRNKGGTGTESSGVQYFDYTSRGGIPNNTSITLKFKY